MPKEPPSDSTKTKKVPGATIRFSARLRRPDNSLICFTGPAMCMTPMAPNSSCLTASCRPGNVHDSNGAEQFMFDCVMQARRELNGSIIESRMDSAFFSQIILNELHADGVFFTASVPFERFPQLKDMISSRRRWKHLDTQTSFFETTWKPKSWVCSYRFIFVRTQTGKQRKGPLQLHLFEPRDRCYDYKVIVTNKAESAKSVALFHNGRGSQEALFGDAKNHAGLAVLPSRRLAGNQLYTLCARAIVKFCVWG